MVWFNSRFPPAPKRLAARLRISGDAGRLTALLRRLPPAPRKYCEALRELCSFRRHGLEQPHTGAQHHCRDAPEDQLRRRQGPVGCIDKTREFRRKCAPCPSSISGRRSGRKSNTSISWSCARRATPLRYTKRHHARGQRTVLWSCRLRGAARACPRTPCSSRGVNGLYSTGCSSNLCGITRLAW